MAVSTDSNILAMLKVYYRDKVENLLFRDSPVLGKFKKVRVGGSSVNFPAVYGHGGAVGGNYLKAKAKIFSRDFIQSKEEYAKDSNGEPIVDAVLTLPQVTYNEVNFDLLNEDQIRVISEVSNTYNKIQKGLKDRLNAIKRYSNKSPKVWR